MCLYLIKNIIFNYLNMSKSINYLLETRELWIIPIINSDTYEYICKKYKETSIMFNYQKN